jgi:hypothetical protein
MLVALHENFLGHSAEITIAQLTALKYLSNICVSTTKESHIILSFTIDILASSEDCWPLLTKMKEVSLPLFIKVWASNLMKSNQSFIKEVDEQYVKLKSPYITDIMLHNKKPMWFKSIQFGLYLVNSNIFQDPSISMEYLKSNDMMRCQRMSDKTLQIKT